MAGPRRRRCIREAFSVLSSSMKRRWRHASFHTKFLDAYCGYSEDRSLHSNCSMNFTSGKHQRRVKPVLMHDMPEAVALGQHFPLEDQQLALPPGNVVLPVRESHSDVYMAPENNFKTPMETNVKEKSAFPTAVAELYEVPQRSGASAEARWPQRPECASPMDTEPSRSMGFLENSITTALQQPPLPEWDGDV